MLKSKLTHFHSLGFNVVNYLLDPFVLATTTFAFIAWLIAFVGMVTMTHKSGFPVFAWWGVVFELLVILSIVLLYCTNLFRYYRLSILTCCGVALVYTLNATNNLIWSLGGLAQGAASAGFILLLIVNVLWIAYFGGDDQLPLNQYIDSFLLGGAKGLESSTGGGIYGRDSLMMMARALGYGDHDPRNSLAGRGQSRTLRMLGAYLSSNQLTGMENFSERAGQVEESRSVGLGAASAASTAPEEIEYKYKARALYLYDANPDDINEISFTKGEILLVDDITGKWWQAKRSNGEVGICPSNYVELLD